MKTERKRWGASLYIYHVYHRLKNIKKHYGWPSFLQRAEKGWRKYDLPQNMPTLLQVKRNFLCVFFISGHTTFRSTTPPIHKLRTKEVPEQRKKSGEGL
jgi:hypothetical protein